MADLKKYMYKRASMSLGKKNGGEDPPKKGSAPLPNSVKAPSPALRVPSASDTTSSKTNLMAPEKYVPIAQRIKNTSERFQKEPNYNVKDAAKRAKGDMKALEKDLGNTRSRMATMFQEGKINRKQFQDSISSTYDLGTPKSKIKETVKSLGGKTATGQVIRNVGRAVGIGKNKPKSGTAMKAECRSRSCSKPGKGF